jgi:hypothetical protein
MGNLAELEGLLDTMFRPNVLLAEPEDARVYVYVPRISIDGTHWKPQPKPGPFFRQFTGLHIIRSEQEGM